MTRRSASGAKKYLLAGSRAWIQTRLATVDTKAAAKEWAEKQEGDYVVAERTGLTKTYIGNVEQATVNITLANLETLARGPGLRRARRNLLRR